MSLRLGILLFILAIVDSSSLGDEVSTTGDLDLAHFPGRDAGVGSSRTCDGLDGGRVEEEEMGSSAVIGRRVLAAYRGRFISYGALNRNRVPCSRRGYSYYNCRRHRRANPYRRGCSIITQCARIFD